MVPLKDFVFYTNELLAVSQFQDYAPNGLQVEGREQIQKVVGGVTASLALIEAAIERHADAVVVHHGYFWRGEDPRIVGMKRRRLQKLLEHEINLLAYHLPLDAHTEVGNNAQLALRLGFKTAGRFGGSMSIGMHGFLSVPRTGKELSDDLELSLGRSILHISGKEKQITTAAWCTGAAQSYIEQAVELGVDAFITGEASEQTVHIARETGIHFYSCGHHATERYGVKALIEHLANRFGVIQEFIDIDNPV